MRRDTIFRICLIISISLHAGLMLPWLFRNFFATKDAGYQNIELTYFSGTKTLEARVNEFENVYAKKASRGSIKSSMPDVEPKPKAEVKTPAEDKTDKEEETGSATEAKVAAEEQKVEVVDIGIQKGAVYEKYYLDVRDKIRSVIEKNKRGHNIQKTIEATKLLKDFGFKINYHIMPGLLGSSIKKDFQMFQELFINPSFQPDMLKIYPTVVIRQSPLYKIWRAGKYKALTDKSFEKFILRVKNEIIPPYVRISRLVRDVPESSIIAGPKISNLRQLIAKNSTCPCIRCREVRSDYNLKEKIIMNRIDYPASNGQEIFLEYTNQNRSKLFALLRLRINNEKSIVPNILKNSAIIREVHTYGKMNQINQKDTLSPQHIGLGKKLILEAEKIAKKEFGLDKIVVISGVGVRGYYRKLGYKLKDSYMVKKL